MRNFLILKSRQGRDIYLSHDPAKFSGDGKFLRKRSSICGNMDIEFVKEGDFVACCTVRLSAI